MRIITIRKIDTSEWRKYKALRLRALKLVPHAYQSTYKEEKLFRMVAWKKRIDDNKRLLRFADNGEEFVGMIGALINWNNDGDDCARLISFYVEKKYRQHDIGTRLLEAVLQDISEIPQITKVRLGVTETQLGAIKLYNKFGFKEISRSSKLSQNGKKTFDVLLMEKRIK